MWIERGYLLAACVLVVYALVAPSAVVDGDNAELSTLATTGGIAHPSGYPWLVLWLRAWHWLPGTPAHAAALATCLLAASAIVALHAACRAWGAPPLAATLACALFATAPVVLRVTGEAEVFAGNLLVVACVLVLAARAAPVAGAWRGVWLGLAAGLGLANHLTCVLVLPVGVLGVVRATRQTRAALPLAVAGLALGLLPYGYALVAPDTPASWGAIRDLSALVAHAVRHDYGSGSLIAHGDHASAVVVIGALARMVARSWWLVPALAGVVLLVWRCVRPAATGESRAGWIALAATVLLAGPVFVSRFDAEPVGIGLYIEQRFFVLPAMLLAIPIACAFGLALARLPVRIGTRAQLVASTVVVAALAAPSLPYLARVHSRALEAYAENTLRMLPAGAVEVVQADAFYYASIYAQTALGVRPDVVVVAWPTMSLAWYRDRVAARGVVAERADEPALVALADHVLAAGGAIFVEQDAPDVLRVRGGVPFGPLVRVLAVGAARPSLAEVEAQNDAVYAAFDLGYPRPSRDDEWATVAQDRYAAGWRAIAYALAAAGHASEADGARARASALEPTP